MFWKKKKKENINLINDELSEDNSNFSHLYSEEALKYTISREHYLEKYKYPPERSLIYFIDGADKKDAVSKALGLAEEHCTAYDNTFYRTEKFRGGYLIEIQEGNKTSFLHSIIKMVNVDNDVKIYFPSQLNHSYVSFKNGRFESAKLDDDSESKFIEENPNIYYPLPEGKMKQVFKSGFSYMIFSLVLFCMSIISLSFAGYSYLNYLSVEYTYGQPNLNDMPYRQWNRVENRGGNIDQYSGALKYQDGKWTVDWVNENTNEKEVETLEVESNHIGPKGSDKPVETKNNEQKIKIDIPQIDNNSNKKPWE